MISCSIPIKPQSQQHGLRARVLRGKFCGFYNDAQKTQYMNAIQHECTSLIQAKPLDGPIAVQYCFYLERPESNTDEYPHMSKEDGDNLQKSVQDSITKIKVWKNDNRIILWIGFKLWCEDDLWPRIDIEIMELKSGMKPIPLVDMVAALL